MIIEILYPGLCGLYGDAGNVLLLRRCLPEAEFIVTELPDPPYFAENHVDMVYLGSMSEKMQPLLISRLMPCKDRITHMINAGILFLVTGNTLDVFSREIENVTAGKKFPGLGLFDLTARIDLFDRRSGNIIGEFEDMEIIGSKAQFSTLHGDNSGFALMKTLRGAGINGKSQYEGVRIHNFFGTYLLGPLLVLNPQFTKYLLHLLEYDGEIPCYEDMLKAHRIRLAQLKACKDGAFYK